MKRSLVVWWCWWSRWQAWQVELTQASNSNGRQFQDEGILGSVAGLVRPLWQKVKFCRIFLPAPNSKMQNPTVKPNQCVSMQEIQKSWQAAKEKTNVYSTSNPDTFQQSYYFSQRDFFLVPRCFWWSFFYCINASVLESYLTIGWKLHWQRSFKCGTCGGSISHVSFLGNKIATSLSTPQNNKSLLDNIKLKKKET